MEKLLHLYAKGNYNEWLLTRYRKYAREELGAEDAHSDTWLAVQTSIQGIPLSIKGYSHGFCRSPSISDMVFPWSDCCPFL